MPFKHRDRET